MEKDSNRFGFSKPTTQYESFNISGWRRIRTFEGVANRFTVCPLWPLGNPSLNFLSGAYRARTYDPLLVRQMLSQLS